MSEQSMLVRIASVIGFCFIIGPVSIHFLIKIIVNDNHYYYRYACAADVTRRWGGEGKSIYTNMPRIHCQAADVQPVM
ncbi:hypothetical protein KT99_16831 [Shewanella benthica KT99]|uniref:Uncharacterized protein n=1 Tax=Shewanella benthica KT99 TaxID=314608 RepID=A9DF58_9GAMM|nr:hypothetical protein KT99_16831 [Shewanella benthica KT99]